MPRLPMGYVLSLGIICSGACDLSPSSDCDQEPRAQWCSAPIKLKTPRLDRRGDKLSVQLTNRDDAQRLWQLQPTAVSLAISQDGTTVTAAEQAEYDENGNISVRLSEPELMTTHPGAAGVSLTIRNWTVSATEPLTLYTTPRFVERSGMPLHCSEGSSISCWVGPQSVKGQIQLVVAEGSTISGRRNLDFVSYTFSEGQYNKGITIARNFDFADMNKYFLNNYAYFIYTSTEISYRNELKSDKKLGQSTLSPALSPLSNLILLYFNDQFIAYPDLADPTNRLTTVLPGATLLATGDIDGDGNLDAVALTKTGFRFFSVPKDSKGSLAEIIFGNHIRDQYPNNGAEPIQAVTVGDIDQDQRPDLLFATQDGLFLAAATGGYVLGPAVPILALSNTSSPVTALYWLDIDGDSRKELIVVSADAVRMFANSGN